MPGFYYQDGANLRTMSQVYYQDGANLRTITEAWYQDGANLRKIWPPVSIGALSNVTVSHGTLAPATATATYTVYGPTTFPGQVNKNFSASASPNVLPETWLLSGSSSDYDVRFTVTSLVPGVTAVTGTTGSWLNLSSNHSISVIAQNASNSGIGVDYRAQILVEISPAGAGTAIGSATITLVARRD